MQLSDYNKIIDSVDAPSAERSHAFLQRAKIYEQEGNWNAALEDYSSYLQKVGPPPEQPKRQRHLHIDKINSTLLCCAAIHEKLANIPAAIECYERVTRFEGAFPDELYQAWNGLARVHIQLGQIEAAIADYTSLIRLGFPFYNYYSEGKAAIARGNLYRGKGDFKQAIADYNLALKLAPTWNDIEAEALHARAEVRTLIGELNGAAEDKAAAFRIEGELPEYQCPCCDYFTMTKPQNRVRLGEPLVAECPVCWWKDDGSSDLHKFSPLNGDITLSEARENFIRLGSAHGDPDLALFKDVLAHDRGQYQYRARVSRLTELAATAYRERNLQQAIVLYTQILEHREATELERLGAISNRASAKRLAGDLMGAMADFEKVIAHPVVAPMHTIWAYRGRALIREDAKHLDREGAINDYTRVVELVIHPGYVKVELGIEVLIPTLQHRGFLRAWIGDLEGAKADYKVLLEFPLDPEATAQILPFDPETKAIATECRDALERNPGAWVAERLCQTGIDDQSEEYLTWAIEHKDATAETKELAQHHLVMLQRRR